MVKTIELSTEIFSPNGDGINDFLEINIFPDDPVGVTEIQVLNLNGTVVKEIAKAGVYSSGESFVWQGDNHQGEMLPGGVYVVWVNHFDQQARKINFRVPVVLDYFAR